VKKSTKKKSSPKKSKTQKKPKRTPKPVTEAAPTKKPEETVDRIALKVIVSQLKEMGSDIKVFKSDTDEQLQKKVNEQLQKMPKDDVLKKLESVVPDKLVTVLKRDCVGIFIDLSDVSCVRCKDSGKCASLFLSNLKGGFNDIQKALPEQKVVEKVVEKVKLKAVSRYEEDRLVFVRDVKNPNPEGDTYHDTLQAVLDEEPGTLAELREIVERDFDVDSDADFMKFVTTMRDPAEGVIKLDVDLSEKNKAELRAAGVEV
jgi:hypothetical protein